MTTKNIREPLAGQVPPRPPQHLRQRVLAAARAAAMDEPADELSIWEVMWSSQLARAAWATALIGLLAAHGLLSLRPSDDAGRYAMHTAAGTPGLASLALPRARPLSAVLGGPPPPRRSTSLDRTTTDDVVNDKLEEANDDSQ